MKQITNFVIAGKHDKPILTDVFYQENQQPKKLIIFCHGYKGFKDWGAWNLMAKAFAEAGFFFVKFNFSHNGGTVTQPIDFPDLEAFGNNNYTKELDDLETVIDWCVNTKTYTQEIDKTNIALIGHSRGGGIVLLKAHEDFRVQKVVTLAAVSDFGKRTATIGNLQDWQKEGVKYVMNGRTQQKMPHFYQFYENYMQHKERLNIEKATKKLNIPHLIVHGDADTSVLIEEAEQLKKWNPAASYKIIENADHVFNVAHPWQEKYMSNQLKETVKLSIDFLKK